MARQGRPIGPTAQPLSGEVGPEASGSRGDLVVGEPSVAHDHALSVRNGVCQRIEDQAEVEALSGGEVAHGAEATAIRCAICFRELSLHQSMLVDNLWTSCLSPVAHPIRLWRTEESLWTTSGFPLALLTTCIDERTMAQQARCSSRRTGRIHSSCGAGESPDSVGGTSAMRARAAVGAWRGDVFVAEDLVIKPPSPRVVRHGPRWWGPELWWRAPRDWEAEAGLVTWGAAAWAAADQ